MAGFEERFWEAVLDGTHRFAGGGGDTSWAPHTGPWRNPLRSRVKDRTSAALARAGLSRSLFQMPRAVEALTEIRPLLDGFARVSERLADDASRDLLVRLLALRVLGQWHVEPPVSAAKFWALAETLRERGEAPGDTITTAYGHPLPRIRATTRTGESVELYAHPLQICEFFGMEQYAFRRGPLIQAEPGDVVVDCGGAWGDTALYFAAMVGPAGRVVAFEFVPENLEILRRNLALNPVVGDRISVVEHPVWSTAGVELRYPLGASGTTSFVHGDQTRPTASISTATIDATLAELVPSGRADLLKFDVEGAESEALSGAEATLRRWRPKLAISVYHSVGDVITLLDQVDALGLGYRFHLDHSTPGTQETIMFAVTDR